jgi:hypothetical protein
MASRVKKPARVNATAAEELDETTNGTGNNGESKGAVLEARVVLWQLAADVRAGVLPPIDDIVSSLSDEQQQALLDMCLDDFERGAACAGLDGLSLLRGVARLQAAEQLEEWTIPAFAMGAFGMKLELGVLLSELSQAVAQA